MEIDEGAPTRERVLRSIHANGPSTAAVLAERLDLTAAGVRRHLEQLLAEGELEARDVRTPGLRGRGRPAKEFMLTDEGRRRFEQRYDSLAIEALRFIADTVGEDAIREFAEKQVSFIEERFPIVAAQNPDYTPAEVLAHVLTDDGYAASVKLLPIGEQVCQQHCPVSHVAHEFPQLCEAETAAISRVLGSHVQRLATIAHGDGVCTTCIPTTPLSQEVIA